MSPQKQKDSNLNPRDRANIQVNDKQVLIDGEAVLKQVLPVENGELFPDASEKEK